MVAAHVQWQQMHMKYFYHSHLLLFVFLLLNHWADTFGTHSQQDHDIMVIDKT